MLTEGLFAAPAYKVYGKIMVEEDYDRVGFTTELALKDVDLTLAAAGDAHVPLPTANVLRDRLLSAIAHGDADRDWAVLRKEQARLSGIDEPPVTYAAHRRDGMERCLVPVTPMPRPGDVGAVRDPSTLLA